MGWNEKMSSNSKSGRCPEREENLFIKKLRRENIKIL